MQNLKFKYRLYPTDDQEQALRQVIGCNRYVWNYFLDQEQQCYNATKKFKFYYQNNKDLTSLKQALPWLKLPPSTSLQQTLRNLNQALTASFKSNTNRKGFPKFKSRRNFDGSFSLFMVTTERNCDFDENQFKVPNIGWIKCKYHRAMPSDFKSCQIKQESGYWFVVLTCSKPKQPKTINLLNSVGIDINSTEFVLSNGQRFVIPKYLRENQARIQKLQRSLSRKTKGSNNYRKAQKKLIKVTYHVRMKRLDYFHKLSKQLVDNYNIISLEDLNVQAMQKWNGHMIKDNGFAMLRQLVEYKAELYGTNAVIIGRYYPSSKTCSGCGTIQNIPLSTRIYDCCNCGLVIDRDLNAAINIDRAGIALI